MKEIILSRGQIAFVDDEDFEKVSKLKWFMSNNGYAVRTIHNKKNCKKMHMHQFVLGVTETVDHRDGDKLNNQKNNLRVATNTQNQFNRGKQKHNTSGFKGVSYRKNRSHLSNPWEAKIHVNKKTYYLGVYAKAKEVAQAYDKAALKYCGEFANFNFPGGVLL